MPHFHEVNSGATAYINSLVADFEALTDLDRWRAVSGKW